MELISGYAERTGQAASRALLLGALFVVFLAACGGSEGDDQSPSTAAPPASVATSRPSPAVGASPAVPDEASCAPAGSRIASIPRDQQRSFSVAPERVIDPAKTYLVTMSTSKGVIKLELDARNAPNTVNNFVFLSCHGFYDGLSFHRVVKSPEPFVIQGGDPAGSGSGGPGYTFNNEISPNLNHDRAGVISMARTAMPNTNGSQFFITLGPASFLNGQYNAFGHVTEGMETVNAIAVGDTIATVSIEER